MTGMEPAGAEITEIYDMLYQLGLVANNTGFFYTSYAVYLAVERTDRLLLATEWLYPEVARRYHKDRWAVERAIRAQVRFIWSCARTRLQRMAGLRLRGRPSPAGFIAILCRCYKARRWAGSDDFSSGVNQSDPCLL